MYRKNTFFTILFLLITVSMRIYAQTDSIAKYQRSSLTMILLQGTSIQQNLSKLDKDEVKIDCSPQAIKKLWDEYPFPDMYDKLDVENPNIKVVSNLSSENIFEARKNKKQRQNAEETLPKVKQELKNKKVAQQVVKRWFSNEDGSKFWDMGTIQKRGMYNATEADAAIAKGDLRGLAKLADSGEELLNNSFVTVTDLLLYANKPVADLYFQIADELTKQANETLKNAGKDVPSQLAAAIIAGTMSATSIGLVTAAAAIKDGYTVVSKTYLFKLKWDEEIENNFYNIWGNDYAFNNMNFELEYIGFQLNETVVNRGAFNKKENRQVELVIRTSVARNIDEAFVELQQENEVFKPSVPILGTDPISAQIGMKEGLQGGERFHVLQKNQEPITGKISYTKVGTVTVNKKYVWDNRYTVSDQPEHINYDSEGKPINLTYFKGGKDLYPGLLLKQAKAKKKKKNK